jgi:hypothetical protein
MHACAGRIFEFVHSPAVVNEASLPGIVGVLLGSMRDALHIAEKVRMKHRTAVSRSALAAFRFDKKVRHRRQEHAWGRLSLTRCLDRMVSPSKRDAEAQGRRSSFRARRCG